MAIGEQLRPGRQNSLFLQGVFCKALTCGLDDFQFERHCSANAIHLDQAFNRSR